MTKMLVKITDLVSPCLTRPRGAEAYNALRHYFAENEAIDIDLDATDAPSSSFLDEMVQRLQRSDLLGRVTFMTRTDRVRKRLSEIADVRDATLYVKSEVGETSRLLPKISRIYGATFEASKKRTRAHVA